MLDRVMEKLYSMTESGDLQWDLVPSEQLWEVRNRKYRYLVFASTGQVWGGVPAKTIQQVGVSPRLRDLLQQYYPMFDSMRDDSCSEELLQALAESSLQDQLLTRLHVLTEIGKVEWTRLSGTSWQCEEGHHKYICYLGAGEVWALMLGHPSRRIGWSMKLRNLLQRLLPLSGPVTAEQYFEQLLQDLPQE